MRSTGIDWDSVSRQLNTPDWSPAECGGVERRLFLGTVFSLYPSGKYYMPFACSNLDPCPACHGSGHKRIHRKRRVQKKWQHQWERYEKQQEAGKVPRNRAIALWDRRMKRLYWQVHQSCPMCDGCGSHEAALDERYRESLESEAEERGYYVTSGDGDPCDIFVVEYREETEL